MRPVLSKTVVTFAPSLCSTPYSTTRFKSLKSETKRCARHLKFMSLPLWAFYPFQINAFGRYFSKPTCSWVLNIASRVLKQSLENTSSYSHSKCMQWVMERLLDMPEKGWFSDFSLFSLSYQLLCQQPDIPRSPPCLVPSKICKCL